MMIFIKIQVFGDFGNNTHNKHPAKLFSWILKTTHVAIYNEDSLLGLFVETYAWLCPGHQLKPLIFAIFIAEMLAIGTVSEFD